MNKSGVKVHKESMAQQGCHHYWIIKIKDGPTSRGVCKFCGAKKDFGNYLNDCLEVEKGAYLDRAERPRHDKVEKEPIEDLFSELKGGDRNAVTAGV